MFNRVVISPDRLIIPFPKVNKVKQEIKIMNQTDTEINFQIEYVCSDRDSRALNVTFSPQSGVLDKKNQIVIRFQRGAITTQQSQEMKDFNQYQLDDKIVVMINGEKTKVISIVVGDEKDRLDDSGNVYDGVENQSSIEFKRYENSGSGTRGPVEKIRDFFSSNTARIPGNSPEEAKNDDNSGNCTGPPKELINGVCQIVDDSPQKQLEDLLKKKNALVEELDKRSFSTREIIMLFGFVILTAISIS